MHDNLDETLGLYPELWSDLRAAYNIHHVFKVGGEQTKGFVQYGPEHTLPDKKVCVITPAEAQTAGINSVNLTDYVHPDECCYVFGPDNAKRGWQEKFDGEDTDYISIITPRPTELFAFMAATMVLWHRISKLSEGEIKNKLFWRN
jgi:hypothetical protein